MTATTLLGACVLDIFVGDPRWLPHPVRWIGLLIGWVDRRVIRSGAHRPGIMKLAGMAVAFGLPLCAYLVVWGAIHTAELIQAGPIVEMLCAYLALAARDLAAHTVAVRNALQDGPIHKARVAVAHIVGRDTEDLSEQDIVRAAIESVAESTCDGIVAPLFFLAIGGAPLAWCYKAVNTLDSLVGHIEPPYRDFGWASARLDDAMNWIPARLTAWLIILAGSIRFLSVSRLRNGWCTLMRDGGNTPAPIAAVPRPPWPEYSGSNSEASIGMTGFPNLPPCSASLARRWCLVDSKRLSP